MSSNSRSSSPEIAPRNSFDSLAETVGPDLIVDILQKERQRQRQERFGPAVRFLHDDWDEFLPEFVTDVNRSKTRQERLESEASQKLRKPLTWNVTVETDGVLEVDASGQARVMALFLHEPQQPGGTDRFLLLEPAGIVGHNQFAPELGRSKQWRIPERDMKQITPVDNVQLKISLMWTKVLTTGRRRPQRLSYTIIFERPGDMAGFLKSFQAQSKHLFKHMQAPVASEGPANLSRLTSADFSRLASAQSFTRTISNKSTSSLFYKEPKALRMQRQAKLLARFAGETEEEAWEEHSPGLRPGVLQTPKDLEIYFKTHASERSAAAGGAPLPAAAYSRYDFDLPLWRNAHVLQSTSDMRHYDASALGCISKLPPQQLKMSGAAVVSNPSHIILDNQQKPAVDLFEFYTRFEELTEIEEEEDEDFILFDMQPNADAEYTHTHTHRRCRAVGPPVWSDELCHRRNGSSHTSKG